MGEDNGTPSSVDMSDGAASEIDLRERLRFAAGSLAADFAHKLTADHVEALVFNSAEGLLAEASVTEFVPILAERRARLAIRSGAAPAPGAPPDAPPAPAPQRPAPPAATPERPAPPAPAPQRPAPPAGGPVFAVPDVDLARLRGRVQAARGRVADWRAELDRR